MNGNEGSSDEEKKFPNNFSCLFFPFTLEVGTKHKKEGNSLIPDAQNRP